MKKRYVLKTSAMYGISIVSDEGGESKPIYFMDRDKKEVSDFVKLCNAAGLEPVHLKDAIDDYLYL